VIAADAELARAAAGGDAGALGALLQRHSASLLAVAIPLVGRDDAQDALHDAFLVALRGIGELRDPGAVGPWLRAIVRTQCLMRLRARREAPAEDLAASVGADPAAGPQDAVERLALRDWLWAALERLSEPLRVTVLLRHFGGRPAYEDVAATLGVPVGTVRSRLNEARLRLADLLLVEAARAHPDAGRRLEAGERHLREVVEAVNRGDMSGYAEPLHRDVLGLAPGEEIHGRDPLIRALHDSTPAAGVRVRFDRAVASAGITVLEAGLECPPDDPDHCPPETTQIHFHPNGRTERILFAYSHRPAAPA
jgi:RNA polymerase sigma-70 factor (ECF subfamily)